MSIISDALKKVQENKTQHKEETQTQVPEEILKSKPKKKEPNPIILILVLFLVV